MANKVPRITVQEIRQLIDAENKNPVWRVAFPPHIQVGDLVGTPALNGRRQASIRGVRKYVSHIVWFYHTGRWPDKNLVIDHKDRDPSNNLFENLREVTYGKNSERRRRTLCNLQISDGRKFNLGMHFPEHHPIVKETAMRVIAILEG